jgi:2-desacetyl-2-hydroxyethyl bacteriochlorophyllide A dehydrogenase
LKTQGIVIIGPEQVALQTIDLREPEADELLIETHCTVISPGTERSFYKGSPFYPLTPGYSVAGIVQKVGAAVTRFKSGDRVFAVAMHAAQVVCTEGSAVRIPDGVTNEEACFGTIGAMAMYAAREPGIELGAPLAILGQGLIGLICTQLARVSGGLPIITTDIDAARMALSKECGADWVFDGRDKAGLMKAVAPLPGGGVDVLIELTAAPNSVALAVDLTRPRGRIFLGSLGRGGDHADVYGDMWRKGIRLIGGFVNAKPHALTQTEMVAFNLAPKRNSGWPPTAVRSGLHYGPGSWTSEADTLAFFDLIRFKRINVLRLITHHFAPSEAPAVFAKLGAADPTMLGTIFNWK